MELTILQNKVFEQIKAFLNSDASVFILRGYAGTGKTTMVKVIADYIKQSRQLAMMAPTGRAARVLATKTGHKAVTIHKAIYAKAHIEPKKVKDIAESEYKFVVLKLYGAIKFVGETVTVTAFFTLPAEVSISMASLLHAVKNTATATNNILNIFFIVFYFKSLKIKT